MSKENHSFSIDLACKLGINAAIIIQHLAHLHKVCLGNGENWKHGRYWINKSIRAFTIVYPYLTTKEIRGALDKLEQTGNIVSAKVSDNHFDRTKWYSIEEDGFALLGIDESLRQVPPEAFAKRANGYVQKGKSDLSKRANENLPKGQMNIKVNYSNCNNSNTSPNGESVREIGNTNAQAPTPQSPPPPSGYTFSEFWNDYGHKVGSKANCEKKFNRLSAPDREAIRETLPLYLRETVTSDAGRTPGCFKAMRQHPQTYLNGRMWATYLDRVKEAENEQPTEYDEAYQKYVSWVKQNFERIARQHIYLTKPQFIMYRNQTCVIGMKQIGDAALRDTLKRAHETVEAGTVESDVFTCYKTMLEKRLKAREV